MNIIKPNIERAKTVITLIWFVLALDIVSLILGYYQYYLLQAIVNGNEISADIVAVNFGILKIIYIISLIVFIISGVTFIQWFRRAYYNLHIKVNQLSYVESLAAGSWFIPIVCLYMPYQIMNELYQKTQELLNKLQFEYNQNLTTSSLGWWWTLWIINGFGYSMQLESTEQSFSIVVVMIQNIIRILLALITIKVIKDYSKVEPLINEIYDEKESIA